MTISEQIRQHWHKRQREIEVIWWLLPGIEQEAMNDAVAAKLQARITACLLMTPFTSESGQQIGAALAQQFGLQLKKLGRLQQLLAEQLFADLNEQQLAWLAPRLMAFWAEMTVGYGQALQQLYAQQQTAQQQKLLAEFQRLTEQVADSEQRFEALFAHSYQPVFLHENGFILAINQAVTRVFGCSAELVGQRVQTLIKTLTLPGEQERIQKHLQAGQEERYQTQCLKKDGTMIAVEATARHVAYRGRTVRMVILRPLDGSSALLPEPDEVELTSQQQAVLQEMAAGFADKEIAEKLGITLATVNHHKNLIFEKLQVDSRAKAIAWVWQKLPPPA